MGGMLSSPVELIRVQRSGSTAFRCGVAEMQGWRINHEDAHSTSCNDSWGSFWVLDGHGGDGASIYCAPELGKVVGAMPEDKKLPADEVIAEGMARVDADFLAVTKEEPDKDSGSTVVGSLVEKCEDGTYTVKLINCGDSRGLIVRGPTEADPVSDSAPAELPVRLPPHLIADGMTPPTCKWPIVVESIDHKPDHPTEKARIEAAGGFISHEEPCRLDANLAVSRGVGDFEYKGNSSLSVGDQKVSCVPDIYEVSGILPGSIIILACDGLWDVMTGEKVADLVRDELKQNPKADLGVMAARLIRQSLQLNSRDNVTVMIVHCVDGSDWSCRSSRFNGSDEMLNFEKLFPGDSSLDEDARDNHLKILRKWKFPTQPVLCSVSGKWFYQMYRCPASGNVYATKSCQKRGWKKHKIGADAQPEEENKNEQS